MTYFQGHTGGWRRKEGNASAWTLDSAARALVKHGSHPLPPSISRPRASCSPSPQLHPPRAGKESIPSSSLFNPSRFDVGLPSPPTSQPIGNTGTSVWPPGGTHRGCLGPEGGSTGHPRPVTPRLREGSHNLAQPGLNSQHTSEDTLPCFKSNYNIIESKKWCLKCPAFVLMGTDCRTVQRGDSCSRSAVFDSVRPRGL